VLLLAAVFGTLLYTAETLAQTEDSTPMEARDPAAPEPDTDRTDGQSDALGFVDHFPSGVYRMVASGDDEDRPGGEDGIYSISGDDAATTSLSDVSLLGLAYRGPLEPGIYASASDGTDCQYELRRTTRRVGERVIGHDRLLEGRMLVTLNEVEPDTFVSTPGCGDWTPWSPPETALMNAGDGDYWLGDLAQGIWEVPDGCYWEKVVAFRGVDLADVIDNGTGPEELVVDEGTVGVRVRNCGGRHMIRVRPAPAYEPPPAQDSRYGEEAS
jgi:hypothetical protein